MSIVDTRLANLYVRELTRDAGWYISAADLDARRQALFLVPPQATLRVAQEPQVLAI
jgi:hypothetical protein